MDDANSQMYSILWPYTHKSRLSIDVSILDNIVEFCDGNPGALNVLMMISLNAEKVDPDHAMASFGVLSSLDSFACYGSDIWAFYKDACHLNTALMQAVLRMHQLGHFSQEHTKELIFSGKALTQPQYEDIKSVLEKDLPNFKLDYFKVMEVV